MTEFFEELEKIYVKICSEKLHKIEVDWYLAIYVSFQTIYFCKISIKLETCIIEILYKINVNWGEGTVLFIGDCVPHPRLDARIEKKVLYSF